ncbi:MAG: hypothetical protein ACFFD4_25405 [Candidatus Odinarchaeota archaeon]
MFFPDPLYGSLLLANGLLALVVAIFVLLRDFSYLLNRLTGMAFIGFSLYLLNEGIIYFFQIEDVAIANVLRKLSIVGVMLGAISIFLAGVAVKYGPDYFKSRSRLFVTFFIITGLDAVLALITESVDFDTIGGSKYLVFKGDILSVSFSHLYPIILIVIGLWLFFNVYSDVKKTADTILARKILLLDAGVGIVVLGAIWMALIRMLFEGQSIFPIFYLPGHVLYFVGAVLNIFAFRSRTTSE